MKKDVECLRAGPSMPKSFSTSRYLMPMVPHFVSIPMWVIDNADFLPAMIGNGNHTTYTAMVFWLGDGAFMALTPITW